MPDTKDNLLDIIASSEKDFSPPTSLPKQINSGDFTIPDLREAAKAAHKRLEKAIKKHISVLQVELEQLSAKLEAMPEELQPLRTSTDQKKLKEAIITRVMQSWTFEKAVEDMAGSEEAGASVSRARAGTDMENWVMVFGGEASANSRQ